MFVRFSVFLVLLLHFCVALLSVVGAAKARTKTVYRTRTVTVQTVSTKTVTSSSCKSTSAASSSSAAANPTTQDDGKPAYDRTYATSQVAYHNQKRTIHGGVPNVVWNDTLAQFAMTYAIDCPAGHSGAGYGENLAWGAPANAWTDEDLFALWYDESQGYDYSTNTFNEKTGHFTQLVWKGTTQIGCAFVSCPKQYNTFGDAFRSLTCEYWPPGNYQGRFTANVFAPQS